ncbi:hypothetical protein EAF64_05635 [Halorientalis pallida]|uniref:Uncharacterized protein n=1 Tax=Halorientalis pallida TaxID=2479928 RepID=A0A498L487_9EURY|nr:hypothetical protein EAF64_05635 [Halorientalis pallida]
MAARVATRTRTDVSTAHTNRSFRALGYARRVWTTVCDSTGACSCKRGWPEADSCWRGVRAIPGPARRPTTAPTRRPRRRPRPNRPVPSPGRSTRPSKTGTTTATRGGMPSSRTASARWPWSTVRGPTAAGRPCGSATRPTRN